MSLEQPSQNNFPEKVPSITRVRAEIQNKLMADIAGFTYGEDDAKDIEVLHYWDDEGYGKEFREIFDQTGAILYSEYLKVPEAAVKKMEDELKKKHKHAA